jgi:histidinol-phosphate aminotransferase
MNAEQNIKFWNKKVIQLNPYVPGEQVNDRSIIKLNTNENPFNPPEVVLKEIQSAFLSILRIYPQQDHRDLRAAVGHAYSIDSSSIFAGNGSDEVLSLIFRTFLENKDQVVIMEPTYSLYSVLAQMYGIKVEKKGMDKDFRINPDTLLGEQKLTLIANPNAPTGVALSKTEIEKLCRELKGLLVVDEAYVDFGAETALPLLKKYDNLIVTRTVSKAFSLAGARLGFAFSSKHLIEAMYRMKDSYNINAITQLIGVHTFKNLAAFKNNIQMVIWNRDYLAEELKKRRFWLTNSKANFIFASHPEIDALTLVNKLREANILIRYFPGKVTGNWVRITIGSMQQMKELVKEIDKIL